MKKIITLSLVIGLFVSFFSNAQNMSVGHNHGIILCNGTVHTWGSNDRGQLGTGNFNTNNSLYTVSITNAIAVGASKWNTIVLKNDGTVWTWGDNLHGSLGNNSTVTESTLPVQVSGLTDVVQIGAGGFFYFLALKSDGTVWTWGKGLAGNANSSVPVQVPGLADIISIACGEYHALALKSDGTVWAWGEGQDGQLGDGNGANSNTPVQVSGLTNVVKIGANKPSNNGSSGADSFALKDDGTLWCWGANSAGCFGNGTYNSSDIPVQSNITDVIDFAVGASHVVALKNDNTVWNWGHDFSGQVTGAITFGSNTPLQQSSITNASEVYAGPIQSYAALSDGTVKAWGYNNDGLLASTTANFNAASFTDADKLCLLAPLSLGENEASTFEVYPNPTNGDFTITGSPGEHYTITDLRGSVILTGILGEPTNNISINAEPGIYLMTNATTGRSIRLHIQ